MIKFPHIYLLHNVLAYVKHVNTDPEVPEHFRVTKPVTFTGTIKLHGSNCGVVWDAATDTLQAQSRETVLTPEADYKGFAQFVATNAVAIRSLIIHDVAWLKLLGTVRKVALYGEWVGQGVVAKPKGSAVSTFAGRHWALFAVFATFGDDVEATNVSYIMMPSLAHMRDLPPSIGTVRSAGNWSVTIDFNDPASVEAGLAAATAAVDQVGAQCPYGKLHGLTGAGEGIVWMPEGEFQGREDLYWKHKTEAHSVVDTATVRERPAVAPDVAETIADFVASMVTDNRLHQGLDVLEQQGLGAEKRNTGKFVQWLAADVEREGSLALDEQGLTWAQVSGPVTVKAREFFLARAK